MSTVFVADISWLCSFCFLNVKDFVSIQQSCKLFHFLTNSDNRQYSQILNNFWKIQTNILCTDIEPNFETKNWCQFYKELIYYFIKTGYSYTKPMIDETNSIKLYNNDVNPWPLLQASKLDCVLIAQMLLQNPNVDVNKHVCVESCIWDPFADTVETALSAAIKNDSDKMVSYLLSLPNIDIFCKSYTSTDAMEEQTPLMQACYKNDIKLVKKLLCHPKMTLDNINFANMMSQAAIFIACDNKNQEISMLLINHGAEICGRFGAGGSTDLLWIASLHGLDWLLNVIISKSESKENPIEEFENKSGTRVSEYNRIRTCLEIACAKGHLNIVKILLENNCKDLFHSCEYDDRQTAFMYAAMNGHGHILKYIYDFLIQNMKNKNDNNVYGYYDETKINKYINQANNKGETAYMMACKNETEMGKNKFENTINILVTYCKVNVADKDISKQVG